MSSSTLKEYMKSSPPFRSGGRGTKQLTAALKLNSSDRQSSQSGLPSEEKYAFFLGRSSPCFVKIVKDSHGGGVLVQPLRPNPLNRNFLVPWEGHLWSAMRSKLHPVEMRIRMEGLEAFNPSSLIRNYLSTFQGAGKVFEYPQTQQQQNLPNDSNHAQDDHAFHDHGFNDDADVVSIDSGDSSSKNNNKHREAAALNNEDDSHPLAVTAKRGTISATTDQKCLAEGAANCFSTTAAPLLSPAPTHPPLHTQHAAIAATISSMIPAAYQSEWDELRSNVLALTGCSTTSAASSSAGNTPLMGTLTRSHSADGEGFILSYINDVLKGQLMKQKQQPEVEIEVSPAVHERQQQSALEVEEEEEKPHLKLAVVAVEEIMIAENNVINEELPPSDEMLFEDTFAAEAEGTEAAKTTSYDPFAIFRRDDENEASTVVEATVAIPLTELQQQQEQYKNSLQTSILETSDSKPPLHPGTLAADYKNKKRRRAEITKTVNVAEPRPKRVAMLKQGKQSAIAKRDGCLGSWPSRKQSAAKGDWKI